ncbi:MAG: MurR/RpiR family transcriptional regulator, partial [Acidimicrobiia bacterium]
MPAQRHDMTVRERVLQTLPALSPAERKVAQVLLAAYPIAGLESITELAERASVSGPTVTRFNTKLGFDGYREFQQTLHQEIQAQVSSPIVRYPKELPVTDHLGILKTTLNGLVADLTETFEQLDTSEFERVIDLLSDPRRHIACTGGRMSRVIASYLYARLHQVLKNARLLGHGPTPWNEELADLRKRDVIVVFDYRRYQADTIALARQAHSRGIYVVLVTDRWMSPIAGPARHVLWTAGESGSPFD